MGWHTFYMDQFTQVETLLTALVTAGTLKQVEFAKDITGTTAKDWPLALINPGEAIGAPDDAEKWGDVNALGVYINGEVIVVVREVDAVDQIEAVIDAMSLVVDQLNTDKTLSGKCLEMVCPTYFRPGRVSVSNKLYMGGVVGFRTKSNYTP